jgi:tetratricopeptide (TPR) repeat protein
MADKNFVERETSEVVLEKAKDFWGKYNKLITIASLVVIVLGSGYYIYKNYFSAPNEAKAADAMFKAEEYFRMDSVNMALNGDGQYMGFLKIMDKFSGTDAANLASYYAGSCYIKLDDNDKAIKYLKKFSGDSKPLQARAYKLMGDAYADLGKNNDALENYKKAGHHFEKDEANSAEYLFYAAYLADKVLKNPKEAIALYKEIKEKFPNSTQAQDVDNYLAQLGSYN